MTTSISVAIADYLITEDDLNSVIDLFTTADTATKQKIYEYALKFTMEHPNYDPALEPTIKFIKDEGPNIFKKANSSDTRIESVAQSSLSMPSQSQQQPNIASSSSADAEGVLEFQLPIKLSLEESPLTQRNQSETSKSDFSSLIKAEKNSEDLPNSPQKIALADRLEVNGHFVNINAFTATLLSQGVNSHFVPIIPQTRNAVDIGTLKQICKYYKINFEAFLDLFKPSGKAAEHAKQKLHSLSGQIKKSKQISLDGSLPDSDAMPAIATDFSNILIYSRKILFLQMVEAINGEESLPYQKLLETGLFNF
ncbi:MAG: hypothetical protein WCT85_03935 [Parachlamydiales bacterium]|jgi:hypothetical protein